MADKSKKEQSAKRLNEDQRFKFIGFEVFPGKPKDLFKSEAEKKTFEDRVTARRAKGEILREDCSLTVERVTMGERLLLTVVSLMVIAALFIPFYSVYSEIEVVDEVVTATESPADLQQVDSLTVNDTAGTLLAEQSDSSAAATAVDRVGSEATGSQGANSQVTQQQGASEVITGLIARKKYLKEYSRLSGLGGLLSIGSVGSYIFSSGLILVITGVLFLVYTLACLALPGLTLYSLYGTGAKGDALALEIKKILKLSWWPVVLFVLAMILSFFGASYGFDSAESFTSLGRTYGVGVFLDSLSYGIAMSMAGFVILAAKGTEI